jgi:hypothetical protein
VVSAVDVEAGGVLVLIGVVGIQSELLWADI